MEAQEVGNFLAVGGVLVNAKLYKTPVTIKPLTYIANIKKIIMYNMETTVPISDASIITLCVCFS